MSEGKSRGSVPFLGGALQLRFSPSWSLEDGKLLCCPGDDSPFFLPPWLPPTISSHLSLHLNPPQPPPFSSHPQPLPCWLHLPFPQGLPATPLPISTVAGVLNTEWRGTDTTWYLCCHITTFPCCEQACQNPVPCIANWELSPAGNSLQTQLADLEIFLTEVRKLRLSILAIMKTLNQICSSIWLMIKENPF